MIDKLFKIELPQIPDEILDRATDAVRPKYIDYIEQHKSVLNVISEFRRSVAQEYFIKCVVKVVLPISLSLTAITYNAAKPNERIIAVLVVLPVSVLLSTGVTKNIIEYKFKAETASDINDIVSTIESQDNNPIIGCSGCEYLSNNSYIPCAVNPKVVNTPEAKDCKDYKPKNML